MRNDLRLTMIFENIHSDTRVVRCLDLDSRLEQIDLKIEKPFLANFDAVVAATKARQHRRDTIQRFAEAFADFLDDRDGWHGVRRQALCEEQERNR